MAVGSAVGGSTVAVGASVVGVGASKVAVGGAVVAVGAAVVAVGAAMVAVGGASTTASPRVGRQASQVSCQKASHEMDFGELLDSKTFFARGRLGKCEMSPFLIGGNP